MVSWKQLSKGTGDWMSRAYKRRQKKRKDSGKSSAVKKSDTSFITPEGKTAGGGTVSRMPEKEAVEGLQTSKKLSESKTQLFKETPTASGGIKREFYVWDDRTQTLTRGASGQGAVTPVTEAQAKRLPSSGMYRGDIKHTEEALMVGDLEKEEAYVYPKETMEYYKEKAREKQDKVQGGKGLVYMDTGEEVPSGTEIFIGGKDEATLERERQEKAYQEYQENKELIRNLYTEGGDWEKVAFATSTGILSWTDPLGLASTATLIGTGGNIEAWLDVKAMAISELEPARDRPLDIFLKGVTSPMMTLAVMPKIPSAMGKVLPLKTISATPTGKAIFMVGKGLTYGYMLGEMGVSAQGIVAYKQGKAYQRSLADLGRKSSIMIPALGLMATSDAKSINRWLNQKMDIQYKTLDVKAKAIAMQDTAKTIKFDTQKMATTYDITGRTQGKALVQYTTRIDKILSRPPRLEFVRGKIMSFRADAFTIGGKDTAGYLKIETTTHPVIGAKYSMIETKVMGGMGDVSKLTYNIPSDIKFSGKFAEPWKTLTIPSKSGIFTSIKEKVGIVSSKLLGTGSMSGIPTKDIGSIGSISTKVSGTDLMANVQAKTLVLSPSKGGVGTWIPKGSFPKTHTPLSKTFGTSGNQQTIQLQKLSQVTPQVTESATKSALAGLKEMTKSLTRLVIPTSQVSAGMVVGGLQKTRQKDLTALAQPVKVGSQTRGIQVTRQKEATLILPKVKTAMKVMSKSRDKQGVISLQRVGVGSVSASSLKQITITTPKAEQVEKIIPVVMPKVKMPTVPISKGGFVPPPLMVGLPLFGLGGTDKKKRKKKKKRKGKKRKYDYTPTLGAVVLGVTTKKRPHKKKHYTGLEIRPVLGKMPKIFKK